MKRTHARYRTLVPTVIALAIGAVAWTVEARQAVQKPPETMAAEKAGWWVRVNPNTAATHVYWRFGATRRQLSAPMYLGAREESRRPGRSRGSADDRTRAHRGAGDATGGAGVLLRLFRRPRRRARRVHSRNEPRHRPRSDRGTMRAVRRAAAAARWVLIR